MQQFKGRLTVPASLNFWGPVAAFIQELAEGHGFETIETNRITLALEEAFSNVVKHGYGDVPEESIDIGFELNPGGMTLIVRDKGLPFDPERIPVYSPPQDESEADLAGLGVYLMKAAVDEVAYINLGRDGHEIRLTKHFDRQRIDRLQPTGDLKPAEDVSISRPAETASGGYVIRPLQPGEAIEVSRCAYRAYGYTYEDYIYYPELITQLNQQGLLKSVAAVTRSGEFMGHAALKFDSVRDSIAEAGVGFVKPEFRRQGLFVELNKHLLDLAGELNLNGVYGRPVTSHVVSQKMSVSLGYRDCGLFLGSFPDDVDFKQITGRTPQRECGLLSFKALGKAKPAAIYPPEHHREFINWLFSILNVTIDESADVERTMEPESEYTLMTSVKKSLLNTVVIKILEYGREAVPELNRRLKHFCQARTDILHLRLNLEDPLTARLTPRFEDLGFFFAGILPWGLDGHHALILQYLNNVPIDYDRIKTTTQEAAQLKTYVRKYDPWLT